MEGDSSCSHCDPHYPACSEPCEITVFPLPKPIEAGWRPKGWKNPYSMEKVTLWDGRKVYSAGGSNYFTEDRPKARIYEEGAGAMLREVLGKWGGLRA